ncbi:MAG: elongation factor G [Clostridia bacterium]
MAEFLAEQIRNIAFIGHGGEGKTTLAEAMLFNTKVIDRQGRVDDGNTVMDYDPEEINKKISISLSMANCVYNGVKINIIDTPGFFDFEGEKVQAMTVAGSALIVTGASGALTVGTEKAMDLCIKNNKAAMMFVNGMDKENANFYDTVETIKAKYGAKIVPLMMPIMESGKMVGYVDVVALKAFDINGKALESIPSNMQSKVDEVRSGIVESAAENDEALMEKYFEQGDLSSDEIVIGLKKGVASASTVPVFVGSALTNKCINALMDKLIAYAPNPTQEMPKIAVNDDEKEINVVCADNAPLIVRVFKTVTDRFVGRLSFFKVESGTLKGGILAHNATKDEDEKISALTFITGKKLDNTDVVHAGDIGAIAKLSVTTTGDTLCDLGSTFKLSPIKMPKPVLSMAVYASKKGEEDKIFSGLNSLQDEDISFTVTKNIETGEMLLNGVGETQIDLLCRKLRNKFGAEAVLKDPRIAYRETIKKTVEAEGKHKKQSGGAGQFGQCSIRFSPNVGLGFEFVDEVVGGSVPRQFIPAVEKGLRIAINEGVLAGYPMVDIRCALFDGKYHPVDSKEIAFVQAAKLAYAEGCAKANPVILEPIYSLKVTVPTNFMGDVYGDMNKRRGRIMGSDTEGDVSVVTVEVPLGEITKYATDLRSMTQGRGSYEMEFIRYDEVPAQQTAKIIEDAKKYAEEKKDA